MMNGRSLSEQPVSHNDRTILSIVAHSALIVILMLFDNLSEFVYMGGSKPSLSYLFFNTSVMPAGLFSRFLTPCVIFRLIWKVSKANVRIGFIDKHHRRKTLFLASLDGGLCVGLSRILFLLLLSGWFPFVNAEDVAGNFITWPYYSYSINGAVLVHIMYILLYGVIYGALWGIFSLLCSCAIPSRRLYMTIPFISQMIWIQLCQIMQLPSDYRMDLWLYMSTYYQSYFITFVLSLLFLLGSWIISSLILRWGGERRVQHGQQHRDSVQEKSIL